MYRRRRLADGLRDTDADAVGYDDGHRNANEAPTAPSTGTVSRTPTEPSTETLGGTPPETRSDVPDGTATEISTDTPGSTTNGTPEADQTVVVGPNGALRFGPAEFDIGAGDTVRWEWDSDGHNVRPSSTPPGATWSGIPGGDDTTYDAG